MSINRCRTASETEVKRQISKTNKEVKKAIGEKPVIMLADRRCNEHQYKEMGWNAVYHMVG